MMKQLLDAFITLAAWLLTIVVYPLLVIVWLQWRRHEHDALLPYRCDGGME